MIATSFQKFQEDLLLNESVQQAKDYLLKRYAEKKEIKTSEIPEKVKKEILNDPKFIAIRDLTQKSPGYTPLFVKFFYEQGATMENLEHLMDDLNKYKQNLAKDLSMPVVDYGKIEPTEEDHRPGWEVLGDELRNIPRKIKLRKLYSELTAKMRKEFARATDKQIDKLTEISNQLDKLPDEDGRKAWDEFTKGLKKYEDTRTYPQYKDTKVAFEDMIKDADTFISAWGESEDELIKKLKKLGAQVGFLYNKDGYTVVSTRAPEALRAVAGDTTFCIRTDSTFWSYGGGRVQLVVLNRNIPKSDHYSLVGITVNPNQTIHTDADRPNRRVTDRNGRNYKDLRSILDGIGLPAEAVNKVIEEFPQETDIKLATEQFFKNQKDLTPQKIVSSLIKINSGVLAGKVDETEWEKISGIVSLIIKETEGLRTSNFMEFFKENGIMTDSGWEVFKKIIGDDYTKSDMEQIYDHTLEGFDSIDYVLDSVENGEMSNVSPDMVRKFKEIKANKSKILRKIEEKM